MRESKRARERGIEGEREMETTRAWQNARVWLALEGCVYPVTPSDASTCTPVPHHRHFCNGTRVLTKATLEPLHVSSQRPH